MRTFVSVTGLRKSYGAHRVLDGIDLTIAQGTVFSLLGPNGAGKTTTVQILSTLIKANAGEIRVAGHDLAKEPDKVRAAIGVTGQFSAVDSFLTGEENLRLMADLLHLGAPRAARAPANCWSASTSPTPRTSPRPPTRAACVAGSTSP
jgi:ABC-2 type transport system ATP-binding protein